jgi:RNA polymerase sigma-70 factor, ECF subfamily
MTDDSAVFERHRPLLLGLAYRLLGSMWDVEDTVQDAYLRWVGTDTADVRDPRAFLVTVVSRLALDRLTSARAVREAYPGPWLPEPVDTAALGPLDTAELRDTVAYATMRMLERLTPPERAVFVLREAFGLPYDEIAEVVGGSPARCRQLLLRARRRVATGRERDRPSREQHERLLAEFLDAARTGDLDALSDLLADDVVAYNDGGGRVRAAPRPVSGRRNVVAFVSGLVRRYGFRDDRIVDVNGEPALHVRVGSQVQVVMVETHDGRISALCAVLNPEKLRLLPAAP